MSAPSLRHEGGDRFSLTGPLDYASVVGLLAQGEREFQGRECVELDLSGVTRANSAGLALLLEWTDELRARGGRLRLGNLPQALTDIARISNVQALLSLDGG